MPQQTHEIIVSNGDGVHVARGSAIATANAEIEIGTTVANSANDTLTVAITVADVVAFWLKSDRNVTVTINDDGTPDQTISLVAGVPLAWHDAMESANPLTDDITSIKIANASGALATISGAFLVGV